jgi:hypothetical protein
MSFAAAFTERALQADSRRRPLPLVRGQVFPIRLVPDTLAGDRFNIGVAFVDAAGVAHCRMASDVHRLRCLYDNRVDIDSFELLRELVHANLSGTVWSRDQAMLSDNIEYGPDMPIAGVSVSDILDRTFDAWVPFGVSVESGARATPVFNEQLQKRVVIELVRKLGPKTQRLANAGPIHIERPGARPTVIRLPLYNRTNGAGADIVSAWSKHRATVYNNMLRSVTNMLAVRYAERHDVNERQLGLFVLQPDEESNAYSADDIARIREWVDDLSDMAKAADVLVRPERSEAALVAALAAWEPLAA